MIAAAISPRRWSGSPMTATSFMLPFERRKSSIWVALSHVAGVEPALVVENLVGGLSVLVVALHNAGTFYSELAYAVGDLFAVLVDDLYLPAVAGNADSADLVNVFHAEVNAAGAYALAEAVVGVVSVVREYRLPALDKSGRNGLSADVH